MKIEQLGYKITGLPGEGSVHVEPSDTQEGGAKISIYLWDRADRMVYDLSEAILLRDGLEHAIRLAGQMAE